MKPWENVSDPSYFRKVLGNFSAVGFGPKLEGKANVRFGTTGNGHAPNYQIEGSDGQRHCFRGMGHDAADLGDDAFAAHNLSEEGFTYAQVQSMLGRLD